MTATTTDLDALAAQMAAENAVQRGRMLARAEEARRVIAKYGDPGGHLDRYARILEDHVAQFTTSERAS